MRGKKAKQIRKSIYGDMAPRRKVYIRLKSGQIICYGPRAAYQKDKKK